MKEADIAPLWYINVLHCTLGNYPSLGDGHVGYLLPVVRKLEV